MVLAYNSDFFGLLVSSYRRTVGAEPAFFEPAGQQPSAPWLDERARPLRARPQHRIPIRASSMPTRRRKLASNMTGTRSPRFPLVSRPSRSTARSGRNFSMTSPRQGFATGYSGLRIAKSGRGFRIEDGVVWQLIDSAVHGQAATFAKWRNA